MKFKTVSGTVIRHNNRAFLILILSCYCFFSDAKTIFLPKNFVDGAVVLTQNMIMETNTTYVIKYQYDLLGATINLPEGSILKFCNDGKLMNGTIIGCNSSIQTIKSNVRFDNVIIMGLWNVAEISSNLFRFSSDDPELNTKNFRSMCMLTSDEHVGVLHISNGIYNIKLDSKNECCFNLNSNTELIIDGAIILEGNQLENYQILQIKKKGNVKVHGSGILVGDVETHLGKTGEWGMGIAILDSDNIEIRDLTIKNCWGDCIYIGQVGYDKSSYSQNVLIDNIICQSGRRQGMSIISGKDIYVTNSQFIDTGSIKFTAPGAGIDIEPNILGNTVVDNIVIEHCEFYGNTNGRDFLTYNLDSTANVALRNSKLEGHFYLGKGSYNIVIDSCELNSVLTPQENYGNIRIKNSVITTKTKVDRCVIIENCEFGEVKLSTNGIWMLPCALVLTIGVFGIRKYNRS